MPVIETKDQETNKILPISFGIGSFIFSVNLKSSQKIEDIILNFSENLRNIPGLSSLRVEPEFNSPTMLVKGTNQLRFLNISFDINLDIDHKFRDGNDKFRIISRAFFDVPITIIASQSSLDNPSSGVVKVREYLRKYLRGDYSLEVIGPSPFHADFLLKKKSLRFRVDIIKQRGYDQIEILSTRTNNIDAFEEFFEEIADELNLFYLMNDVELFRVKQWGVVQEKIDKLQANITDSWFDRMRRKLLFSPYIGDIMESVISFESMTLSMSQLVDQRYEDTQRKYLAQYLEKERKGSHIYPVESVRRLLDFQSSRRSQFNQNLVTTVNTIVSVLLTALITYLFFKVGIRP